MPVVTKPTPYERSEQGRTSRAAAQMRVDHGPGRVVEPILQRVRCRSPGSAAGRYVRVCARGVCPELVHQAQARALQPLVCSVDAKSERLGDLLHGPALPVVEDQDGPVYRLETGQHDAWQIRPPPEKAEGILHLKVNQLCLMHSLDRHGHRRARRFKSPARLTRMRCNQVLMLASPEAPAWRPGSLVTS